MHKTSCCTLLQVVVIVLALASAQGTQASEEKAAEADAAAPQALCATPLTQSFLLLSGRGCCSHHRGQCGCQEGRVVCCDGTLSPSCRCAAAEPDTTEH